MVEFAVNIFHDTVFPQYSKTHKTVEFMYTAIVQCTQFHFTLSKLIFMLNGKNKIRIQDRGLLNCRLPYSTVHGS